MSGISTTDAIHFARTLTLFLESDRLSACLTHHSLLIHLLEQSILEMLLSDVSSDSDDDLESPPLLSIERPNLTRQ